MTQEITQEEFEREVGQSFNGRMVQELLADEKFEHMMSSMETEAKSSGCKVCQPVEYELTRVEQGYSSVATFQSADQKYVSWVVPIKDMTFRVQVPSELDRCNVVDLETGVMLGHTDYRGIFEMPHNLFVSLSRKRICYVNSMLLEAGPVEERKLLKASKLLITAEKTRVNDLVLCAKNTPIHNMELVDTGVLAHDNQWGCTGRENFNITCLCTRENVILKSDGVAIFRMC